MKRKIVLMFSVFAIFFSSLGSYAILTSAAPDTDSAEITIIMYHSILNNKRSHGAYCISEQTFKSDIQMMLDRGYTPVVIQDLYDFVYNKKPLPAKPIVITFDDGYYNNFTYAYAILKQNNLRAVLSPVGIYSEQYSKSGDKNPNYSHLSFEDLVLVSDVFEIQNHSYNMHSLDNGRFGCKRAKNENFDHYKKIFCEDTTKMQQLLLDNCGITPICYTYPYGGICYDSIELIKEMGFIASLSCEEGKSVIKQGEPDSLFCLKRYNRANGRKIGKFITK